MHKVDSYFIFEISENTENELNSLMSKIAVDTVLIPSGAHDELLLERIEALLSKNGVSLSQFSENTAYTLDNFSFLPIILKSSESDRRDAMYFVTLGSESALFASSGIMTSDNAHFIKSAISSADAVIFGKYGYSYSPKYYFDEYYDGLDEIIVSGENIYLTPDIAVKYEENGCKITSHPSLYRLFN